MSRQRGRVGRAVVVVAAVVVASTAVATQSAEAAPADVPDPTSAKGIMSTDVVHAVGGTPEVLALMKAQVVVDRVADRIEAAAQDTATSGIGGLVVDPTHQAIKLYWHGELSAAVADEIAAARAQGVTVKTTPAAYRRSQLVAEARRVALSAGKTTGAGARVVSAAPMPDGSGLDIGMSGAPAGVTPDQARQLDPALRSATAVSLVRNTAPVLDTRQADTRPFWGGALIVRGNVGCSSGFGVTGNNGAATYILTAAHCGTGAWTTGAGVAIGSTIATLDWSHDAELILTPASGGTPGAGNAVYDGASIAGGTQFYKYVVGASATHNGDSVCTSGAFSGAVCGVTIYNTTDLISVEGHVMTLVRGEQSGHQGASGSGDSGGPVFSLADSNAHDVARGTLTGHDSTTTVACPGVPSSSTRACGWRIWFPQVTLQAAAIGFHVNTL